MVEKKILIELLLGLVLVVILFALLYFTVGKEIFPWMRSNLINKQANKDEISNNFDTLLRNLESCSLLTQDDCVCEGFLAWPSFQKETILTMETRGIVTTFILKYEKEELRNEKLENLKLNAKLIKKGTTPDSYVLDNLASDPRIIMDWKTNPPVLSLGGDPGPNLIQRNIGIFRRDERKAVSGLVYRNQGKIYFLTSFEPADKLSSFIGSLKKCGATA